jgi:hypothetical protein
MMMMMMMMMIKISRAKAASNNKIGSIIFVHKSFDICSAVGFTKGTRKCGINP